MSVTSLLLIQEPPLQVLPSLAVAIGLEEAIVLQQLHYWLNNPKVGEEHDGTRWIYNTYAQWQTNFPFWSASGIRKFISRLEDRQLVLSTDRFNQDPRDRTKWYTINYELLSDLTNPPAPAGQSEATQQDRPPAPAGQLFNTTKTTRSETTAETNASEDVLKAWFDAFWQVYPRRVDKAGAWTAWKKLGKQLLNGTDLIERIMSALEAQIANNWLGKDKTYIPYPATWLNHSRWEDEIERPQRTVPRMAPNYYKPNGGLTAEGMAAKARGEIQ